MLNVPVDRAGRRRAARRRPRPPTVRGVRVRPDPGHPRAAPGRHTGRASGRRAGWAAPTGHTRCWWCCSTRSAGRSSSDSGEHPLLRRLMQRGTVSKLSSQFPSTTAAHMTRRSHTGAARPWRSGSYEWFMYEPRFGELIAPLLFSPAGDHGQDHLLEAGVDPLAVFPWETMAQRLAAAGVAAHAVQPAHMHGIGVRRRGAARRRAARLPRDRGGVRDLGAPAAALGRVCFMFAYFPEFDAVAHEHGRLRCGRTWSPGPPLHAGAGTSQDRRRRRWSRADPGPPTTAR